MVFNPKVSIVIPVYNGSDYLKEAIESALAQTYDNIEIIIVNDGSKDDGKTEQIAMSYGDRIGYFKKENGGVSTALNLAIRNMQGDYFSWLSHDDIYFSEKIKIQVEYLSKQENKNLVLYSDYAYINEKSEIINNISLPHYEAKKFRPFFIQGGYVNGCTLLIPKICFDACGLFNTKLKITQDYELWFVISEKFEFHHLSDILVYSRIHENQVTFKFGANRLDEANLLYINFLKKINRDEIKRFSNKNPSGYYLNFSLKMSEYGFYKAKSYALKLAIFNLPFSKFENLHSNLNLFLDLTERRNIRRIFKILIFLTREIPNKSRRK